MFWAWKSSKLIIIQKTVRGISLKSIFKEDHGIRIFMIFDWFYTYFQAEMVWVKCMHQMQKFWSYRHLTNKSWVFWSILSENHHRGTPILTRTHNSHLWTWCFQISRNREFLQLCIQNTTCLRNCMQITT